MAKVLQSESRRLYSWWWDSHIPKNSKWLQDNLADMDSKVKSMIKLIEEDADSFARRAEMYYKKRPELMKLVEEFYRAYRALAERYDHATVELHHAHKTMSDAFPNQLPFEMSDDSESVSSEPRTPEKEGGSASKRRSRQLTERFRSTDRDNIDAEVESLKRILSELQDEKEALSQQYHLSLNKLSRLEKDLDDAQNDVKEHDDRATKAEIEINILKEALVKLEAERDDVLIQYNQTMERVAELEALISKSHEDAKEHTDRATKAEAEAQTLKQELSRIHAEKEAGLVRYEQCLEMISRLEDKIRDVEENAQMYKDRSETAHDEIKALKQDGMRMNKENRDLNLRYQKCLETIEKLENELSHAHEDAERLSSEVLAGAAKLKTVEDQCVLLESSNQNLKVEADDLMQKIEVKDRELFKKQNELEKLQILLEEEHFRFSELEASLRNLKRLHSQSQDEQKALALELQTQIQMLRDLEMRNDKLEDDMRSEKEENRNLRESNNSSAVTLQVQQYEISSLKEIKEKLEEKVERQMSQSNVLQEEIYRLKNELESLNKRCETIMEQIRLAGLDPEFLASSIKKLRDENSKLIDLCNSQRGEKESVAEKLHEMDGILRMNAVLENSLVESNTKIEGFKEKTSDLLERCEALRGDKSDLVAERANLLSQLQMMTENMQKMLEKNTSLENSLSGANIELQGLRERSKCFEEFFQFLKNEKAELLKERESLVSQMNRVEERLGGLEKKFTELERKCVDLQREKRISNSQVEELRVSLAEEKQERATYERSTETRLADLQKNVSFLREECRNRKKEYEEELGRAVKAQVEIIILQKFIEDLEQKNFSLLRDCQKYVEASKLSEKLISELESENLEQQMEAEFLLGEINNLRGAMYQVLKALQLEADYKLADSKISKECILISRMVSEINDLKCSLSSSEDEMQRLVVENSVLLSLFEKFQSDGLELESKKGAVEKDLKTIIEQHELLKKDKEELREMNQQLKSELIGREQQEQELKAELQKENVKVESLNEAYEVLQREYCNELDKNNTLIQKFSELKSEMCVLEEENLAILQEAVALSNMSVVYQSIWSERAEEVKAFAENMNNLQEINLKLKHKIEAMEERLRGKEAEGEELSVKLEKLNAELKKECEESKRTRDQLERQISDLTVTQREEIRNLNKLNKTLESEAELLQEEIKEQRVREECLSLELEEKSNEFKLWDSEATSFYFDLQISAVREVLLENKVHELAEVCENLRDETVLKTTEVNRMKETVGILETEIDELKIQLSAYDPVVESLAEDIKSLEQTTMSLRKHPRYTQSVEHDEFHEERRSKTRGDGIVILRKIKTMIKTIEDAVVEEMEGRRRGSKRMSGEGKKAEEIEIEDDPVSGEIRQIRSKPGISLMKDIPLDHGSNDQMLELWEESAEAEDNNNSSKKPENSRNHRRSRNPSVEMQSEKVVGIVDKRELSGSSEDSTKIQDRLMSDSRRLVSLRYSIRDLKNKLEEMKEKQSRSRNSDYMRVTKQLKETEEAILQLVNTTEILTKEIGEACDGRDVYRKVVMEKSKNGSEKIEQLQSEMQNIERIVLKLEEDGSKSRLRKKFSESRTAILLREIVHSGGKRTSRTKKKKKNRFCGCMRSSTNEE